MGLPKLENFHERCVATLLLVWLTLHVAGCSSEVPLRDSGDFQESVSETAEVRLTVEAPTRVRLSDRVRLNVQIAANPTIEVHMPPFGGGIGGFRIVDLMPPMLSVRDGRQVLQQEFLLEPSRSGDLPIDPITISYVGTDGERRFLESDMLTVSVSTQIEAEGVELEQTHGLQMLADSGRSRSVLLIGGAVVLATLAAGLLWARMRPRPGRPPTYSPRDSALQRLAELEGAPPDDPKAFYRSLTDIVRTYLEESTDIPVVEQTTDEFLQASLNHPQIAATTREQLQSFLHAADLVKFAGRRPDVKERAQSMSLARQLVTLDSSSPVTSETT